MWWDGRYWSQGAIPIRPTWTPEPEQRTEAELRIDNALTVLSTPFVQVFALLIVAALPWVLISSTSSGALHTIGVLGVVLEVIGVVIAMCVGALALLFGAVHTAERIVVVGLAGVIGATAYAAWKAGKWLSQNVPDIIDRGLTTGALIDIEVNGVVHEQVRVVEVIHTYESGGNQSTTAVRVMEQQRTVQYSVREITRIRIAG